MNKPTLQLTDEEMRDFIINGYVKVKPDFPPSFHEDICQRLDTMFEETGNLGNNLLPAIPEIQEVLAHVKSKCDCSHKVNNHKGSIFR